MISDDDVDGDGVISYKEFEKLMTGLITGHYEKNHKR